MRSYIKIFGPNIIEALKALEKLAIEMPSVCIMDTLLSQGLPYFGSEISVERCEKIISKHSEMLGEYDFFFEWFKKPDMGKIETLIKQIDETLKPIGVRYTITTKNK